MDFFIAYEVNNPINYFFYKPIKLETNFFKISLDENAKKRLNPNKLYQFYFNLMGTNFVLIGKPYKVEDKEAVIFIKDGHIELRRYPRIDVEAIKIPVNLELLSGYLKDISLGGCKIAFEKPVSYSYLRSGYKYKLLINLNKNKTLEIPIKIVGFSGNKKYISCAFAEKNKKVLELYQEVLKKLKEAKIS